MTTIDTRKLARWYDVTARLYSLWRDDDQDPMLLHVASLLREQIAPSRVLDAGCGSGLYAIGLAAIDGGWRVDAVDLSGGMLRVARRRARVLAGTGPCFSQADLEALPFRDEAFDVIVAAGLVPNLARPDQVFGELRRVLRPGGQLLLVEVDRSRMSRGSRLFFHSMILGYRAVSSLFRRYRFAERWSLRSSTVDPGQLADRLSAAGFVARPPEPRHGQLLFRCDRPVR